jgi:hypothetical protein
VLPTLAGASLPGEESARVALPCVATPEGQDDPSCAVEAARRCRTCPTATACLLEAMRLDAAWRRGEDPWGAYGVWGGLWFSPGHMPVAPPPDADRAGWHVRAYVA